MSAPRALVAALAACTLLALPTAAHGAFVAPSPIRQWSTGPSNPNFNLSGIGVSRSGNIYALKYRNSTSFRVLDYRPDGTPVPGQWKLIHGFTAGGLTTDPVGHVLIAGALDRGRARLLEYTADGGLLAAIPAKRLYGGSLDSDRHGRIYANGTSPSGKPSINEYSIFGAKSKLIATGSYPGKPSDNFFPANFLGIAVGPSGNVYGSGTSTTSNFLARFVGGLGPPVSFLEQCPAASDACFGGFGVGVASTAFSPDPAEPMVYAAGGYGNGADSGNFYATGIYRAFGDPSQYQGSFNPIPLPGSTLAVPYDAAGSPCRGFVYTLNSRFGGPGATYDGAIVQQFRTHAPAPLCSPSPKAELTGLKRRYSLRPARHANAPCSPCAKLLPSGAYANRPAAAAQSAARVPRRPRAGLVLRFRASAAADVTFAFKRVAGPGAKTSSAASSSRRERAATGSASAGCCGRAAR